MKELPDYIIDELLKEPPFRLAFFDPERPNDKIEFCSVCGGCETPESCPAAFQCPECCAIPGFPCMDNNDMHPERIEYARTHRR